MKIKIAAATLALILAPTISMAMGCNHSKEKQAMSCAEGTTYDSTSGTCVVVNA